VKKALIALAVLLPVWTAVVVAGDASPGRTVNLNGPDSLEALQQSNPTHYKKVRKILDGILEQPDAAVPRWIQTNFDARNVSYVPILMTSAPPKRRLSFALDETRYEAVITLTNVRAEIVPLK
jgi:hypothetical protein